MNEEEKQELETLGLTNILLTDHCYVYAKLPSTPGMENCKSIGFIAHMDTAPDFPGKDVKPQIKRKSGCLKGK